jgi:predicted PurR-regulated permease PerM
MNIVRRNSYLILVLVLVLVKCLGLGALFITVLFSYFVLNKLHGLLRTWLTVLVFVSMVLVLSGALGYFLDQALTTLPKVASTAIPKIIQTAKEHNLELPFSNWDTLKTFAMDSIKDEILLVSSFAKTASIQIVFLIIGIVIAISLFLHPPAVSRPKDAFAEHLYAAYVEEISARFHSLYQSFATVMGAQFIISLINTTLTAMFVLGIGMPHPVLIIGATFLCGMLPIIGNLISNSVIVAIGFTVSPQMAMWALIFLIVLHKLEYFLNSKIIGSQIKNPVWLTLIGLVIGERLMGITGMILAPVLLHFIRIEASRYHVSASPANQVD